MESGKKPAINRLAKKLIKADASLVQGGTGYNDCYWDNVGWVCRRCGFLWIDSCGQWRAMPPGYNPGPYTPEQ